MNINKVNSFITQIDNNKKSKSVVGKDSFGELLNNALNQVNELQINSDEYKKMLAIGEVDNLHDVTIASEKANISLQIVMSIRNKVVDAYREIMRIQI